MAGWSCVWGWGPGWVGAREGGQASLCSDQRSWWGRRDENFCELAGPWVFKIEEPTPTNPGKKGPEKHKPIFWGCPFLAGTIFELALRETKRTPTDFWGISHSYVET